MFKLKSRSEFTSRRATIVKFGNISKIEFPHLDIREKSAFHMVEEMITWMLILCKYYAHTCYSLQELSFRVLFRGFNT